MRYLKKYKIFLENLEINDTDDEDVKASKEGLNKLKEDLDKFNQKKNELENLFKNSDNIKEINDKLSDIIGEEDDRNPFLSQLATIHRIRWQIQKKHDDQC
jgi:vacuolar-type H+-ATPase subunit I/STV1